MNASRPAPTHPAAPAPVVLLAARRAHRERDFGVGYGSSSGYASVPRYTRDWAPSRFRCA
ncbi:hypothetical protein [Vulcaniibacterium tengchongense]|uniref:Uncharacterized protein n=1 Tax=Vulcaniibacterium tengchongense TaxID=1273429 RepID=A0A3N4VBR3_9GAMM|nr:hypothetical protein [Vulcaniibacterium tengchongense]RPE80058.1 hypothetical protein EDC50_1889 [Vulcaniibacterium tengchongense]